MVAYSNDWGKWPRVNPCAASSSSSNGSAAVPGGAAVHHLLQRADGGRGLALLVQAEHATCCHLEAGGVEDL